MTAATGPTGQGDPGGPTAPPGPSAPAGDATPAGAGACGGVIARTEGTGRPRVRPYGEAALLVDVPTAAHARALGALARELPDVEDVVPAASSLLVRVALPEATALVAARLAALGTPAPESGTPGRHVEIPVTYDGEDLPALAAHLGLSVGEVVARHSAPRYTAAFAGFAPGFVYLEGVPVELVVPRRSEPRKRVPRGAVALAAGYTAVYPRESPGGWHLLGRTEVTLFDPTRAEPALVRPGDTVSFVPDAVPRSAAALPVDSADGSAGSSSGGAVAHRGAPPATKSGPVAVCPDPTRGRSTAGGRSTAVEVLAPGPLTIVTDLGRAGRADVGVAPSGAFDVDAHRTANALVGNDEGAATLEVLLGPLVLRADGAVVLAVVGPAVPVRVNGLAIESGRAIVVPAGARLEVGPASAGLRCWVAVAGGWDVPPVVGSRARDTLAGLGPEPLAAGTVLTVGRAHRAHRHVGCDSRTAARGTARTGAGADLRVGVGVGAGAGAGAHRSADAGAVPKSGTSVRPAGDSRAGAPEPTRRTPDAAAPPGRVAELPVLPPPRPELLAPGAWDAMLDSAYIVSHEANRVAVRLDGPAVATRAPADLPSQGLVAGAVQVPPSGRPVVFGPDHPLTGGYPVAAVLTSAGLARLAQLRPGAAVRFVTAPAGDNPAGDSPACDTPAGRRGAGRGDRGRGGAGTGRGGLPR